MNVVQKEKALRAQINRWKSDQKTIGFVPTMGALHEGHMKLVDEAKRLCDRVVLSIYVNPTQFGPQEDYQRYPRPWLKDNALCKKRGVDLIYRPSSLYEKDVSTSVLEESLSKGRCGNSRPGHFKGVATVVTKLLNLVQPDQAFFGWKDAQQVQVIQRVVRDLNIPVKIQPVEIIRDRDGLALSSRNIYLSERERETALAIPLLLQVASLRRDGEAWLLKQLSRVKGIRVDYVEKSGGRLCVAAWVGKTRLLDNRPC
ncbi:MAG: pantoate--beta-alanine ligase [Verrucomicrobiota bacterium]